LGAPLSIQQVIEFFSLLLSVLPWGISPELTAARMELRAAKIWE
jgi:hypothetical protein